MKVKWGKVVKELPSGSTLLLIMRSMECRWGGGHRYVVTADEKDKILWYEKPEDSQALNRPIQAEVIAIRGPVFWE